MARYNEILAGRYNRFLQKLLQMKGGPPAPQLSSEIGAGFVLFNGVENRYLEGWDLFGNFSFRQANPGFNSKVRVRNPVGSNVVAVFQKISIFETANFQAYMLITQQLANLAVVNNTQVGLTMDARTQRLQSQLIWSEQNTDAVLAANKSWQGAGLANSTLDVIWDENQEIPILPGWAIDVVETTANQQVNVGWFWRERPLEESELK
jgi:hypothetical protein